MPKLQVFITEVKGRKPERKGHITLKDFLSALQYHFYWSKQNFANKQWYYEEVTNRGVAKQVVVRNNKLEERELLLPVRFNTSKELKEFIVKQLSPVAL